jgi:hypothetical protein
MSPALLGLLRGLGFVVITSLLTFLGDGPHLTGILNPATASVVAMVALALEHAVEGKTGNALFGAVKTAR